MSSVLPEKLHVQQLPSLSGCGVLSSGVLCHLQCMAQAHCCSTGYVPPHSRRGDGTSSAASFSLSQDASGPGKLGSARGRALPPGAGPPDTKSASKNSKRRSKKKGGGASSDAIGEGEGGTGGVAAAVADAAMAGQQMQPKAGAWLHMYCLLSWAA